MSFLDRLLTRARPHAPRLVPALVPAFALGESLPGSADALESDPHEVPSPGSVGIDGPVRTVSSDDEPRLQRAVPVDPAPHPGPSVPARASQPDPLSRGSRPRSSTPMTVAVPRAPEPVAQSTIVVQREAGRHTLETIVERHTETRTEHQERIERRERVVSVSTTPQAALPPLAPPVVPAPVPAVASGSPPAAPEPVQIHIGKLVVSAPAPAANPAPSSPPPGPAAKSLAQILAERNGGRR